MTKAIEQLGQPLGTLREAVGVIAQEAGAFIRKERANFSLSAVEEKGTHDLVSYVDRGAERMIVEALTKLTPQVSILGEEGGKGTVKEMDKQGWQWIVDPLDGTTNFVHGMPPYAVSIGLVYGGEAHLGAIYDVVADELYLAHRGGGATLNGTKLQSSGCKALNDALVGTGFPYSDYSYLAAYMKTLDYFMRSCHGVRRLGSAAMDLAYVAAGRLDAFYEYGLKPWDVAAGIIIAQEAGVQFSDFVGGANYLYGGELLCATKALFDEFSKAVVDIMGRTE